MKKEHKEILALLGNYFEKYPEQRFGQALTNLGVLEFADKTFPPKEFVLRDIYNDSDKSILEKIIPLKQKQISVSGEVRVLTKGQSSLIGQFRVYYRNYTCRIHNLYNIRIEIIYPSKTEFK